MSAGTGKSGTIKPEEFEKLSTLAATYGATTLAQKVGKVCSRVAEGMKHEYPGSTIAAAWSGAAAKITGVLGAGARPVSTDAYSFVGSLVKSYGPEVVTMKLAKIAKKANSPDATRLSGIFPKA